MLKKNGILNLIFVILTMFFIKFCFCCSFLGYSELFFLVHVHVHKTRYLFLLFFFLFFSSCSGDPGHTNRGLIIYDL